MDIARAQGFVDCDRECTQLQERIVVMIENMRQEIAQKNERLRAFNQIDSQGRLRPTTESYKNPKKFEERPVTGKESWMK